jgi:NAD(P)-dependent dehydrogenase (short-subunit alcohol dehydrogenase family)
MHDFTNRAAFVTGGSRGVGRAIALEFAARGASVAVVYKERREAAEKVAAEVAARGGRSLALKADVGDSAAVAAAFARARLDDRWLIEGGP